LLAGLDRPELFAEQLYEPVPLGFSLDEGAPPSWGVDEAAFEAAGGRVAALDQRGTVMLGDVPLGKGRVVVIGGLLAGRRAGREQREVATRLLRAARGSLPVAVTSNLTRERRTVARAVLDGDNASGRCLPSGRPTALA
jgi:hypothetical protein